MLQLQACNVEPLKEGETAGVTTTVKLTLPNGAEAGQVFTFIGPSGVQMRTQTPKKIEPGESASVLCNLSKEGLSESHFPPQAPEDDSDTVDNKWSSISWLLFAIGWLGCYFGIIFTIIVWSIPVCLYMHISAVERMNRVNQFWPVLASTIGAGIILCVVGVRLIAAPLPA